MVRLNNVGIKLYERQEQQLIKECYIRSIYKDYAEQVIY